MRDEIRAMIPVPLAMRQEHPEAELPEWAESLVDEAIVRAIERDGRKLHEVGLRRIDWLPDDAVLRDADGEVVFDFAAMDMAGLRVLSACED